MNLLTISTELQEVLNLIDEWNSHHQIPDIEREIALDKLKDIYANLKNNSIIFTEEATSDHQAAAAVQIANKNLQGLFYEISRKKEVKREFEENSKASFTSNIENISIPDFPLLDIRNEMEEKGLSAEEAAPILHSISNLADSINSNAKASVLAATATPPVERHAIQNSRSTTQEVEQPRSSASTLAATTVAQPAKEYAEPTPPQMPVSASEAKVEKVQATSPATAQATVVPSPNRTTRQPEPEQKGFVPKGSEPVKPKVTPIASNLQQPKEEPALASTSQDKRLGEVIAQKKSSLNESISPKGKQDLASVLQQQKPIGDLHKAISFNDKFRLIRELFKGDGKAYEKAIGELNQFETLDEAIIHISESYSWNPSSPATALLIELLQRKFSE